MICLVTVQNEEQIVGESELTLNYLFEILEIVSKFHVEFPEYQPFEQFSFLENNGWGKFIDDELIRKLLLD